MRWPLIEDEHELLLSLQEISQHWQISMLTNAAPSIASRLATHEEALPYEELRAKAELKKQTATAASMLNRPSKKYKKSSQRRGQPTPSGRGKGNGRGRGTGVADGDDAPPRMSGSPKGGTGMRMLPAESSDSSSSEAVSSTEEYWRELMGTLEKNQGCGVNGPCPWC